MNAPSAVALLKSEAICLNVRPFSKTSHMVTWLTAEHGRLSTPVKGAQRPKSGFVGRYDLGYVCEVVFYARERNGVHHIRECTPLRFNEALRGQWRATAAAGYVCDLALRAARPGLPLPQLYAALAETLDALPGCAPHELTLAVLWMECRTLEALGVPPVFARCAACPPSPRGDFSVEEGRFVCEHRPSRLRRPATVMLHDHATELYALLARTPLGGVLREARASGRTDALGRPEPFPGIFGLRRFLGLFLAEHLDLLPGARRTALDLLIG